MEKRQAAQAPNADTTDDMIDPVAANAPRHAQHEYEQDDDAEGGPVMTGAAARGSSASADATTIFLRSCEDATCSRSLGDPSLGNHDPAPASVAEHGSDEDSGHEDDRTDRPIRPAPRTRRTDAVLALTPAARATYRTQLDARLAQARQPFGDG